MPSFHVYICDRCSRRYEGTFMPSGWCEISVVEGFNDEEHDPMSGPDMVSYLLCDDCSLSAVDQLKDWVLSTQSRSN